MTLSLAGDSTKRQLLYLLLFEPVDWCLILAGGALALRSWRLFADCRWMIRGLDLQLTHPVWVRSLGAVTGIFALALLGCAVYGRYEVISYLVQPGVNPRREQAGILAYDEGVAKMHANDAAGAERSLKASVLIWEEFTKPADAPIKYRRNLADAIFLLGRLAAMQEKSAEVQSYLERGVAIGDALVGHSPVDEEFDRRADWARQCLADLRLEKLGQDLDTKSKTAFQKYEDAVVKADKGQDDAIHFFARPSHSGRGAPQVQDPEYRSRPLC